MKTDRGTYVLVLRTETDAAVEIGRWGVLTIQPGHYLYIGSAFGSGGVRARVTRHCRQSKPKHWHIDYLRELATVESVWYSHRQARLEHHWAKALAKLSQAQPVLGFGCSDCRCDTHLFYFRKAPNLAGFAKILGYSVQSCTCEEG
ncbi:MAG: GIY-YIG nuclease family protein [Candidatus Thiodiazotropha sp.]